MFMRRYRGESLIFLILVVSIAVVFWRVLEADFVFWDDDVEIYANPHLKGITPETLRWMFFETGYVVRYQPLTWLTWSIIYEFSGLKPIGYHLASLLFHCANGGLVFLLIRKLLLVVQSGELDRARYRYLLICAGLGALLWALHPLRVEAVAWVSAFLHCQALLFILVAALCYLEASTGDPAAGSTRFSYWASVISFALSLLSYPIGLGFVVILVVLDVFPLKRFKGGWWSTTARRVWLEKLPFVLVACLVLGLTLLLRFNTSSQWVRPVSLGDFGLLDRVMQAAYVEAYYLWKPWVPFDLSPVYTTLVKFNPTSVLFLLNAGLILMTSVVLVWKRSQWPAALALWVCHLIWLVPVLGLTEHPHYTNDRYSLAGGIWWSVLASTGLFALWDKRGRRMVALAAVVVTVLALGILSVRQINIWKHSVALFEYMIARLGNDPYRADIYWRLGVAQMKLGQRDAALGSFDNVLRIDPKNVLAHKLTADICYNNDRFEDARRHYEAALQVDPDDAELQNGLGSVFVAQGDWIKGTEYFSRAVRLNPDLPMANYNMGLAMVKEGRVEEAKFYLERARKLKAKEPSTAK